MVTRRFAYVSAWVLLGGCAPRPQATPRATSSAVPRACDGAAAGVTFCVEEALVPSLGAVVTADSVFRVSVRYLVPRFRPGEWTAIAMFAGITGDTRSGPVRDRGSLVLGVAARPQRRVFRRGFARQGTVMRRARPRTAGAVTEPPTEVTQRRATIAGPLTRPITSLLAKQVADRPQGVASRC